MNDHLNNLLAQPLRLPNGTVLKNRIIKSPMSDSLGDGQGNPTKAQMRLYERWAEGGAALSLIGEVQVDAHYPEKPGNLVFAPGADLAAMMALAKRGSANGAQIWPQLGHAGALAHAPISNAKGPSPLDVPGLRCEGLTFDEVQGLPSQYAHAALFAKRAGFGGVQIHAGHGFLFTQFLSPLFNHRSDSYGGDVAGRFRVIGETIAAVRNAVGSNFPIGLRINATDMLESGLTEADAFKVVALVDQTSVDLLDISGGTYFPGAKSSSDSAKSGGAYFAEFAKRAKSVTAVPIALTGGITTRAQAVALLENGHADAISLARALVMEPALPQAWMAEAGAALDPVFPRFEAPPKGGVTAWYSMRLTALGEDDEARFDMTAQEALQAYDARDEQRCATWKARFGVS